MTCKEKRLNDQLGAVTKLILPTFMQSGLFSVDPLEANKMRSAIAPYSLQLGRPSTKSHGWIFASIRCCGQVSLFGFPSSICFPLFLLIFCAGINLWG